MEAISQEELAVIARVVEVTSDAVVLCSVDGTVLHVNQQLLGLLRARRDAVVGRDLRDLLFSEHFERAGGQVLPVLDDGSPATCMLVLADGSFLPVRVRALRIGGAGGGTIPAAPERLIVALTSLEERYASDRQQQRLLQALRSANKRLSGTLSIIMATVGSNDLAALVDTVLNRMTATLDAKGATLYFTESGGFKLRGTSRELAGTVVPDFIPYGAGVPTHVLRAGKACRLSVVRGEGDADNLLYDMDAHESHRLRQRHTPPFKTLIAVPVYFGTQMLGTVELGWARPCNPSDYDVSVLNVICEYLSIELVGMVSSIRTARIVELERSLNRARDLVYAGAADHVVQWGEISAELRRTLKCQVCPVFHNRLHDEYVLELEDGRRIALPASVEELFFSSTAPAARTGTRPRVDFGEDGPDGLSFGAAEPEQGRLARVDRTMSAGRWLARQGLPSQGVFVDMGPDLVYWDPHAEEDLPLGDEEGPARTTLATRASVRPSRMLLLLREAAQEPIDDLEYDYLTHLVRDIEVAAGGARRQRAERRIAQTLQAGMRSTLERVPGITTDSLYSSATSQALVGGDFYTLIRLPDDMAVMILGDVSGKGIEAASMSALVKTALSAYAWEGASPAQMARSLNSMLMSFSRPETFASAFIAKIDLRAGRLTYCSAGHPPAMLVHQMEGGAEVELVSVQSGVIGAFEGMAYRDGELDIAPGDILFMYTDGAIEARDPQGAFFGEDRLRDVLLRLSADGLEGLCQQVLDELDDFSDSALDDDIALVALRIDAVG